MHSQAALYSVGIMKSYIYYRRSISHNVSVLSPNYSLSQLLDLPIYPFPTLSARRTQSAVPIGPNLTQTQWSIGHIYDLPFYVCQTRPTVSNECAYYRQNA